MVKTRHILSADIIQVLKHPRPARMTASVPWWLVAAVWALIALMVASPMMGCAHGPRTAPAFGFQAVQCAKRVVVCVPDADMPGDWCATHVLRAVKSINEAAGTELFFYGGAILGSETSVMDAVKRGHITVWTDRLPAGVLGVTNYNFDRANGCIDKVMIRLNVSLQVPGKDVENAQACITHELLHAAGAGHADVGAFPTLMAPAVGMPQSTATLSPNDRAALWAVYHD